MLHNQLKSIDVTHSIEEHFNKVFFFGEPNYESQYIRTCPYASLRVDVFVQYTVFLPVTVQARNAEVCYLGLPPESPHFASILLFPRVSPHANSIPLFLVTSDIFMREMLSSG
jgi:hypothetical protein